MAIEISPLAYSLRGQGAKRETFGYDDSLRSPFVSRDVASNNSPIISSTLFLPLFKAREQSLDAQEAYLLAMPLNWDGYGAEPISKSILLSMRVDLESCLDGIPCRAPDLIPGSDGSIQAEWHQNSISITYNLSAIGERFLSVERPNEADIESFARDALFTLQSWAPHLVLARDQSLMDA